MGVALEEQLCLRECLSVMEVGEGYELIEVEAVVPLHGALGEEVTEGDNDAKS